MNTKIENTCNELNAFAQSLKQNVASQIKGSLQKQEVVVLRVPQVRPRGGVANPERPWVVGGAAALAVGVLGAIFSDGSWSYVLGGAGLVSILYGQTKKKPKNECSESQTVQPVSEPKGFEVASRVIEISKDVEKKWRDKVEEAKSMVQRAIEDSNVSSELKDSLIGKTYTTERVSIDFDDVVSRLESQASSAYLAILSDYGKMVNNSIDKAADEQIAIYRYISQKL